MIKKITRNNLEKFLEKYATEKRTLDVGSGGSKYGQFFPNRITVDIDKSRQPDIIADAHSLPFKDGEFEIILCTEVLEHVKNPFKVEEELWRVLKPGGMLLLSTRFIYPIHDAPSDFWRFTKYGLRLVFERWEIIELKEETGTIPTLAVLLQRIGFQTRLRVNKLTKFLVFLCAWFLNKMNRVILKEYGDIKKNTIENNIMSSGYYLACVKKKF